MTGIVPGGRWLVAAGWMVASASLPATAAHAQGRAGASADQGGVTFRARCAMCHATVAGQTRVGPSLAGVVGRQAGTAAGGRYSPALRRAALRWDVATLDRYLADPGALVPGTGMAVKLADARQRADVIAFLAGLK